jgi:hypothetical protein
MARISRTSSILHRALTRVVIHWRTAWMSWACVSSMRAGTTGWNRNSHSSSFIEIACSASRPYARSPGGKPNAFATVAEGGAAGVATEVVSPEPRAKAAVGLTDVEEPPAPVPGVDTGLDRDIRRGQLSNLAGGWRALRGSITEAPSERWRICAGSAPDHRRPAPLARFRCAVAAMRLPPASQISSSARVDREL